MSIASHHHYQVDLSRGVQVTPMGHLLFTGDRGGDVYHIKVLDGGKAVDVSGASVTAYMMRSDRETVVLEGKVENGAAVVVLDAACYAVTGRAVLVIKMVGAETITTIFAGECAVMRSSSDTLHDPGGVIPSLEDLLAQIEAMEEATEAANKAAERAENAAGHIEISPEAIQAAVNAYLEENPVESVSPEEIAEVVDAALQEAKESGDFDGEPGVSATHKWDGTTLTITSASGTSSADLKGDPGDPGSDATVTEESIQTALGYTPADAAAVFELAAEPLFDNFFDDCPIEYGKIINTDGTVSDTEAALAITDFIPIKAGDVIRMADFGLYPSGSCRLVVYNSAKTYIIHVQATALPASNYYIQAEKQDDDGNWVEFTVVRPSAGGYIRFCTNTAAIGKNPVLTINQEITYTETYGTVLNPRVKVDHSQITNSPQKNGWSILPYEHLNICYSDINRKPINTVEHFVDAAENFGYNALKCDVRPTSDGELVCCHDAGFTFDSSGYITSYDSANQTKIHDVTSATVLGYSFKTGEHPCLVGDYLDVCRKYGKVAFITIRNEYMDVVIPKLLEELRIHNMTYATIINCMTYESLVQWRQQDQTVMINYTLNYGVAIDQAQIDRAIGLGYCSLCGFSLSSASTDPSAACDFEYARENGIRLLEAIAYKEGSPEACYALGYDGCQIGIPWGTPSGGVSEDSVQTMIDNAIGAAIGGSY